MLEFAQNLFTEAGWPSHVLAVLVGALVGLVAGYWLTREDQPERPDFSSLIRTAIEADRCTIIRETIAEYEKSVSPENIAQLAKLIFVELKKEQHEEVLRTNIAGYGPTKEMSALQRSKPDAAPTQTDEQLRRIARRVEKAARRKKDDRRRK
jgi:hypothetical protein